MTGPSPQDLSPDARGRPLRAVVAEHLASPAVLEALFQSWTAYCRRQEAGPAHGRVLVAPGATSGTFDWALDGDPAAPADPLAPLAVGTALKGLAILGPRVWRQYDTGDNLLFREADFRNPAGSAVMRELWLTMNPGLQALVGRLALACRQSPADAPRLDAPAPGGAVTPLTPDETRSAAHALGFGSPRPAASGAAVAPARKAVPVAAEPPRAEPKRLPLIAAALVAGFLMVAGAVVAGAALGREAGRGRDRSSGR